MFRGNPFKRSAVVFAAAVLSVTASAIGTAFIVKKVSFDKKTGELSVVYTSAVGKSENRVTDSGPFILCVVNRLLKHKYKMFNSLKEGTKIEKSDLALFRKSAHLLPEKSRDAVNAAITAYVKSGSEADGAKIFNTYTRGMAEALEDHKTQFASVTEATADETVKLRGDLAKVEKKIAAILDGGDESKLDADEKVVVRKLKREKLDLEEKIADAKPAQKIEKGTENPVKWSFCLNAEGSKSQTSLANADTDEMIKATDKAVEAILLARAGKGAPKEGH